MEKTMFSKFHKFTLLLIVLLAVLLLTTVAVYAQDDASTEEAPTVNDAPVEETGVDEVAPDDAVIIQVPAEEGQGESTEPPIIIQIPAEEEADQDWTKDVQDIIVTIGYGVALAFLAAGLFVIVGIGSAYRDNLRMRFLQVDNIIAPFGQNYLGRFAHENAQRLYAQVDEPTDALVGKTTAYINQLVRRQLISPEQASAFMRDVVGAAVELTDGVPLASKQPPPSA
jgi:hypothetical protein